MPNTVSVTNLAQFKSDLKIAEGKVPADLNKALKLAGIPIVSAASALTPRLTGTLAAGYKVSVAGTRGSIISSVPYAGGAEWGRFRKWSGFNRYGSPGSRFAGKAIDDLAEETLLLVAAGLRDVISLHGWAT